MSQSDSLVFGSRQAPYNQQAEMALLGAILANNKAYEKVAGIVEPDHFFFAPNRKVFEAASRLIQANQTADAVTLKSRFSEDGVLGEVGGTAYLTSLINSVIGITAAPDYAKVVRDLWLRRQMIDVGETAVLAAFTPDSTQTASKLLDETIGKLMALDTGGKDSGSGIAVVDAVDAAIAEGEEVYRSQGVGLSSMSTGIPSVDRVTLRLRRSGLYVIGGRPGMGKTALGRTISINLALGMGVSVDGEILDDPAKGMAVAVHSLEESDPEFGAAALSQLTGISLTNILTGDYLRDAKQAANVIEARKRYARAADNFSLFSEPGQSLYGIAQRARAFKRKKKDKFCLLVVDYLQLMKDPPGVRERRLAIGDNAQGLKNLAKELNIAVILLSQLNRNVEGRTDKRPTMADLNESGNIEAAADVIMFPYREAYYFGQTKPKLEAGEARAAFRGRLAEWQAQYDEMSNYAELNIGKHRRGKSPNFAELMFLENSVRFEEPSNHAR